MSTNPAALAPLRQETPGHDFLPAVLFGLSRRPRSIPARFLYDARGSELFDMICELPEYYVTRAELGILQSRGEEIAAVIEPGAHLIEFGSGSVRKAALLLEAMQKPRAYTPVDISAEFLRAQANKIAAEFPAVEVLPVCADFSSPLTLPLPAVTARGRRVGLFAGSTIGNMTTDEAIAFLRGCRQLLGAGAGMLVGVDLKKDPALLHAAYNDSAGVTAAFTLNLIHRMNRELRANFAVGRFAHHAFYNAALGRIEIYLRSLDAQMATIAGRQFTFARDELIRTEFSYKYSLSEFRFLARCGGFAPRAYWTDLDRLFAIHYLVAT